MKRNHRIIYSNGVTPTPYSYEIKRIGINWSVELYKDEHFLTEFSAQTESRALELAKNYLQTLVDG